MHCNQSHGEIQNHGTAASEVIPSTVPPRPTVAFPAPVSTAPAIRYTPASGQLMLRANKSRNEEVKGISENKLFTVLHISCNDPRRCCQRPTFYNLGLSKPEFVLVRKVSQTARVERRMEGVEHFIVHQEAFARPVPNRVSNLQ